GLMVSIPTKDSAQRLASPAAGHTEHLRQIPLIGQLVPGLYCPDVIMPASRSITCSVSVTFLTVHIPHLFLLFTYRFTLPIIAHPFHICPAVTGPIPQRMPRRFACRGIGGVM
ncbi:MAG: hypothetical protein LUH04_16575, partial [Clostridium sp.]|nr:hypothetical protein [Clostridium sp.]